MKSNYVKKSYWSLVFLGCLAAGAVAVRLGGHFPNVTPVAAIALLAGATMRSRWAPIIPLTVMAVSDMVIGFSPWPITVAVYGSFALMAYLGTWLRRKRTAGRVVISALAASTLFYLITNGVVWLTSGLYAHTLEGLILCYYLAIPFFRNTMLGDLAYTGSLFLVLQYAPVVGLLFHKKIRGTRVTLVRGSSSGGQKSGG